MGEKIEIRGWARTTGPSPDTLNLPTPATAHDSGHVAHAAALDNYEREPLGDRDGSSDETGAQPAAGGDR